MLWGFRSVFAMMLLGFVIHWLPTSTESWYRERFIALPLWAMALACVVAGGVIYKTVTEEAVPFIYFHF